MAARTAITGRGVWALSAAFAWIIGMGASPGLAATFVVDSTADAIDSNLGDGVCGVEGGGCTLRAAVMEANATAGADIIDLSGIDDPANPIELSLAGDGPDEFAIEGTGTEPWLVGGAPNAAEGDLDILEDVTIFGAGMGKTVITWAEGSAGDRIFHLQVPTGGSVALIEISDLAVVGGSVITDTLTDPFSCATGEPVAQAPEEGPPSPPTEGVYVFKRFGGGIAIGPGAGVGNTCVSGGDEGGMPENPGGDEEEEGGIEAVELTRILLAGNSAESDAGGMHVAAPLTLSESVISDNLSGGNGGGLYLDVDTVIQDTTIGKFFDPATPAALGIADAGLLALVGEGNHGENGGGYFDTGFHTTVIRDSAINGNTAIGGGGIASRALITTNMSNSTISGNLASDVGGGITTNGTFNLVNVTIANNTATTDAIGGGGGLNSFDSGTYSLANTLIFNNLMGGGEETEPTVQACGCTGAETCSSGIFITRGNNLEDADSCSLGVDDFIGKDARALPLLYNGGFTETHGLPLPPVLDGSGSLAVDAGNNGLCPNEDQRGILRSDDGDLNQTFICDIGAFELFIPRADLHVNDVDVPAQVRKGSQFRMEVQVHNDFANTIAEQVQFRANIPGGLDVTGADWALAGGVFEDCAINGGAVACAIGDMPVASTADIRVDLSSNGSVIYTGPPVTYDLALNVETITTDMVPGNNLASPKVGVMGLSDVGVTATASATEVDATNPLSIAYAIVNDGEDFASGMRFGIALPAGVDVVSATPDSGNCSTGGGSISCTFAGLAAGAGTLGVEVVLEPAVAGEMTITGEVLADQFDLNGENDAAVIQFTSIAIADLALSGSGSRTGLYTGDNVTVTLTATNAGPLGAQNLVITGAIPAGMAFVSGDCTASSGALSCEVENLAAGDSEDFSVVLTASTTGSKTTTLSLSSDTKDPVASNDTASLTFTVTDRPSSGGGGCVSRPGSGIDPTLLILLALSVAGLASGRKAA